MQRNKTGRRQFYKLRRMLMRLRQVTNIDKITYLKGRNYGDCHHSRNVSQPESNQCYK